MEPTKQSVVQIRKTWGAGSFALVLVIMGIALSVFHFDGVAIGDHVARVFQLPGLFVVLLGMAFAATGWWLGGKFRSHHHLAGLGQILFYIYAAYIGVLIVGSVVTWF